MKAKAKNRSAKKESPRDCRKCGDPLESWGVSTECRLFRCAKCGIIRHVDWGKPLPPHDRTLDHRCGEGWLAA